jgi:hypothetical protein
MIEHLAIRPRATATQLQSRCEGQYEVLKQRVLGFLISAEWLLGEAANRSLSPARPESRRRLVAASDGLAASNGQSQSDLLLRAGVQLATSELRQEVLTASPLAKPAQLAVDYHQYSQRLASLEQRDAEVVRTRTKIAALRAAQEIRSGVPFSSVAKRRSVDALGKTNGGLVPGIVRSQEDPVLGNAVFSARPHDLTGPVQLEVGRYYLFEVIRVATPRHETLTQFTASMSRQLRKRTLAAFAEAWKRNWTAKTDCHAGYVVPQCSQYRGPQTVGSVDPFTE